MWTMLNAYVPPNDMPEIEDAHPFICPPSSFDIKTLKCKSLFIYMTYIKSCAFAQNQNQLFLLNNL